MRAATNRARMMQHFINGHGKSGVVAEDHHAEGIADENYLDTGFIKQTSGWIVVSRQTNNFWWICWRVSNPGFALQDIRDGDFAAAGVGNNTHVGLRCHSLSSGCSPVPLPWRRIAEFSANH